MKTCSTGKHMHETREEARQHLITLKTGVARNGTRRGGGVSRVKLKGGRRLGVYRCDSCAHWHVGNA